MNPNADWARVRALYVAALEKLPTERDGWLREMQACEPDAVAEVRLLLDAAPKPSVLGQDAASLLCNLLPNCGDESDATDQTLGPHRLIRLLGSGGMGRVYLAERADGQFKHQVALKILRSEFASPELHRRFLRERDTLARLSHPNIAQLHDGGIDADGRPYFTLELVAGEPLTAWCDARQLGVRARIQLLMKVCEAVGYAHRNFIVHRDLKPNNILVTENGEPKLLDFGIAKALDDEGGDLTATSSRPLTPEYAAPEQVLGEPITTATDVYALGVVLYILLCGRTPYRRLAAGDSGWVKAIVEENAEALASALQRPAITPANGETLPDAQSIAAARRATLTTLRRTLRGDLERIVQRTLAKSPQARYPTVDAFAADLRAYAEGRAISGGTRTYQLRKFVRRFWLPLAATATFLVLIVGGSLALAWQAHRTEMEARKASAVKDYVLELFRNANPSVTQGRVVTLRDVVDRGVQRLDAIPAEQAEIKAELQNTLGSIYFQLGLYKDAAALHGQAFAAVASRAEQADLAVLVERNEATEFASLGDNARAQQLIDDAVQRMRQMPSLAKAAKARVLSTASWIAKKRGDAQRAKQFSEESFALASQPPQDDGLLFAAYQQRGTAAKMSHDYATALDDYDKALALSLKLYGRNDQDSINAEQLLGTALFDQARYDDARTHLQAAIDASTVVFGESNARTLRAGEMLALNDIEAGRLSDTQERFRHMLALIEAARPRDEELLAEMRLNYAELLIGVGKLEQAEVLLHQVDDVVAQHAGSTPEEEAEVRDSLGYLHLLRGDAESAERELRSALDQLIRANINDVATVRAHLGEALIARGAFEAAVEQGRLACDNARAFKNEKSLAAAYAHYSYALALHAAGRDAQAVPEIREALGIYAALLPPDGLHPLSADARFALGEWLVQRPDTRDEGVQLLQQAATLRERHLGADHPKTLAARTLLRKR